MNTYSAAPRPRADRLTDEPAKHRDPSPFSLAKIVKIEGRTGEPLPPSTSRAAQSRASAAGIRAMQTPKPPVPRRTVRFRSDIAPPVPRAAAPRRESEPPTVRPPRIVHDHRLNVERREAAENERLAQAADAAAARRAQALEGARDERESDRQAAIEYETWLAEVHAKEAAVRDAYFRAADEKGACWLLNASDDALEGLMP